MSLDVHKIFFDDESYNSGHGKAYDFLGIQPEIGAIVIVRPDQRESSWWCVQRAKLVLT